MLSPKELFEIAVSDSETLLLADKSKAQLAEMISEDFSRMKDYSQNNPHHCFDLLLHSLHATVYLKQGRLSFSDFEELRVAALFHDIGKPLVAKDYVTKTVYRGHAEASEKIARVFFSQIGVADERKDRICFYIRNHDIFISLSLNDADITARIINCVENARKKYKNTNGRFIPDYEDFQKLLYLCRADISAQNKEVFENGRLIDSRRNKFALIHSVEDALKSGMSPCSKTQKSSANSSFFFFPFKSAHSMHQISADLDASGCWIKMSSFKNGVYQNNSDDQDNENARYLLRHVGEYFHSSANEQTICIQRKLDRSCDAFKTKTVSRIFNTEFQSYDSISQKTIAHFRLKSANLYCFDTSICFLVVEIKHIEQDLQKISNSLFALKEFYKDGITIAKKSLKEVGNLKFERFLSWNDIISLILSTASETVSDVTGTSKHYQFIGNWSVPSFQRIFIMSYIEMTEPPTEEYVFRLSHCYNDSFDFIPDTNDLHAIYKNNNICTWGVSTESAVCFTELSPQKKEFIKGTFFQNICSGYQLLFVLLLHQKYVLQEFLAKNELRQLAGNNVDSENAKKYRDKLYLFEQKYNFRYISDVSQYQKLYELIYNSFKIDLLFADVKEPLNAIESAIEERENMLETERDKKMQKALTVLSVFAFFSAVIDAWDFISELLGAVSSLESAVNHIIHLALVFCISIAYLVLGIPLLFHSLQKNKKEDRKKRN